ncbi:MAG: hypothetical protein WC724_02275 [Candidatus Paceibacterota bacterium]|jgi:hypothetical protein
MKTLKNILLGGFFVFIVFVFLYPNPFGNNPDIIADESYFLTSSLSAIEKITLPGWEFSQSGNYYGGVQTYIDYFVLIPVLGVIMASHDFSVISTKLWVALNTGELLHILRIVNGLLMVGAIIGCYFYFSKRNIPKKLSLTLILFLFLLLSNVLIIQFFHTAKIWGVYIIITSIISALFIANEYYLTNFKEPFIKKEKWILLLVWSSVFLFFQNYVGAISIFLITIYALLLEHLKISDLLNYLKKYWYLIILFALTQISFIHRAIFLNWLTGSFAQIIVTNQDGQTDWFLRLYNPLLFTIKSHPLVVLLFVVSAICLFFSISKNKQILLDKRKVVYLSMALAHPFLVYLIFHVAIGFSFTMRYAIFLTLALAFSSTILLSEARLILVKISLGLSALLFFIIGIHSIPLYWHESSEMTLLKTIEKKYNSPTNVFIEKPDALHLTLPINADSLSLLNKKRQSMGRFQFLSQNQDLLRDNVSFKPLTLITYSEEELSDSLAHFQKKDVSVWTITTNCNNLCTYQELTMQTCFEVRTNACGTAPQEINLLAQFLSSKQLGHSYVVRKIQ